MPLNAAQLEERNARLRAYILKKRSTKDEAASRLPKLPKTPKNTARAPRMGRVERMGAIKEMVANGWPTSEISKKLKVSQDTVHIACRELGVRAKRMRSVPFVDFPRLPLSHPCAKDVYADTFADRTAFTSRGTVRVSRGGQQPRHTARILEAGRNYPTKSYTDIARMLGISKDTVHGVLVSNGLARKGERAPNFNFVRLDSLWEVGVRLREEFQRSTGLSKSTVSRYLVHKRKQLDAKTP